MSKLLILLALGLIIYFVVKARWSSANKSENARRQSGSPSVEGETMVRCKVCGVHLPVSEARRLGTDYFCGAEHERGPGADA